MDKVAPRGSNPAMVATDLSTMPIPRSAIILTTIRRRLSEMKLSRKRRKTDVSLNHHKR
jgi:hypothetical protein